MAAMEQPCTSVALPWHVSIRVGSCDRQCAVHAIILDCEDTGTVCRRQECAQDPQVSGIYVNAHIVRLVRHRVLVEQLNNISRGYHLTMQVYACIAVAAVHEQARPAILVLQIVRV